MEWCVVIIAPTGFLPFIAQQNARYKVDYDQYFNILHGLTLSGYTYNM